MSIDQSDPHLLYLRIKLRGFINEQLPNLKDKEWTRQDYKLIEVLLKEELKKRIVDDVEFAKIRELSVTTLERFFEKYDHPYHISQSTVDKICLCLGFAGYQDYVNNTRFDELGDRSFVDTIVTVTIREMLHAFHSLPYIYSFSSYFEPRLAFEIASRLLKTSKSGYYLVDGFLSDNKCSRLYKSDCYTDKRLMSVMKPNELWIESVETWKLNWVDDYHNPDNTVVISKEEIGKVRYQLVQVDGLWRVYSIEYPENLGALLFK